MHVQSKVMTRRADRRSSSSAEAGDIPLSDTTDDEAPSECAVPFDDITTEYGARSAL